MERTPDDRLRRLASHYEAEVDRARADRLAAAALLRARPQLVHRRRSWQVAVASAAAALMGFAGLGALADQAIPGQALYPIDRAYEAVAGLIGGSHDRSEERLVEALALIDRGRESEAVDLIDEAIAQLAQQPEFQVPDFRTAAPAESSTTLPSQSPATTAPSETTESPDPAPVVVASAADVSTSLRLATEFLLRTVRDAKNLAGDGGPLSDEVNKAASELIVAAQVAKDTTITIPVVAVPETTTTVADPTTPTSGPTTTSTAASSGTTTTTTGSEATTTTTEVTGSTTTTTQPGDGDGGPGPIIIPPQP